LYNCTGANGSTTSALGPAGWAAPPEQGGPCVLAHGGEHGAQQSAQQSDLNGDRHDNLHGAAAEMYLAAKPRVGDELELQWWYHPTQRAHYFVASDAGVRDAAALGFRQEHGLGWVRPPPGHVNATSRYGLPAISRDDLTYIEQDYWRGRTWTPMIQIVYWALAEYQATLPEARGAADGLAAQSKALLLREWRGYGGDYAFAGTGRYVYENFDADTAEGYGYSSEAQPMYSWGALAGFIGLQQAGVFP